MSEEHKNSDGLPLRIYRCAESAEYAKRVMAHRDIEYALQCLIRLRDLSNLGGNDDLVRESLWSSAIVRAFSVFDGQNALSMDILDQLPEGAKEAYKFFRNYRSKHIAHKVNPIDQIKAGIILSEPNLGKKEILGVGNLAMNDASFSDPEFVDSLGNFLDALLKQIAKEIQLWSDQVLEAAKKEDIDELYKLPPLRVVVPSSGHLH
ncbi:MAG: hypothetical protein KZQ85_11735 [Candidatus Thiodiazotropha sp. (ex Myrtea sp. 'scaly one' KF741663)]|nr:hypothetical protein [Candidatus Thiodiazotropha sp. (ex Myrtea sp. 'scaly one' KF741663)]